MSAVAPLQPAIDIPEPFERLYNKKHPDFHFTHHVYCGGRSALKSWNCVRAILIRASNEKLTILCIREYRESMRFSIKALIELQIENLGQQHNWDITHTSIVCLLTGSEFVFYGMNINPQSSKSFEGCDILLAEEAGDLSNESLKAIIPTVIRKKGAKFVWIFNPEFEDDPVYDRFIVNQNPKTTIVTHLTFLNNPFINQETIETAREDRERDYDEFCWQWLGQLRKSSNKEVFSNRYTVKAFDVDDLGDPIFGLDFGFSPDPIVLNKMYYDDDTVYIRLSHCKLKDKDYRGDKEPEFIPVELDEIPDFLNEVEQTKSFQINADSSRPDIISYLRRLGWTNIVGAKKPKNSIEFGVKWLRGRKNIVIHPEAGLAIWEARNYSHKVHKKTKEITREIVDEHNHSWDATRYGFVNLIYSTDNKYSGSVSKRQYTR